MNRIVAASTPAPWRAWRRAAASLLLAAGLAPMLSGCAWLDVEQRELALRPTPGRPAAFAPGAPAWHTAFRPGDERWTVAV
ncbi:MAG: hypothetical protein KGL50_07700, partial [Burkholderiales bacterium]|nr:hypothetical protein [Burkholderiales bacterium]